MAAELRFQVRLGEVYDGRLGDRARAIDTYRGVLEREPSHPGALPALARLYKAQNDLPSAAEITSKLLDMASGAEAVALAIELGELSQKLGNTEQAALAFERGLSHDPSPSQRTGFFRLSTRKVQNLQRGIQDLPAHLEGKIMRGPGQNGRTGPSIIHPMSPRS